MIRVYRRSLVPSVVVALLAISVAPPVYAQRAQQPIARDATDTRMIDATSALPQVGELVPRFEARLMTGGVVNADSLVGAPFIVALWSTDCPGSRQALRGLQSLHETLRDRGVRFLILATDTSRTALQTFLQQQDVRIPVAQIDAEQMRGFVRSRRVGPDEPYQVVFAKPSFLVTDAASVIVAREGGGLREEFLREVQELPAHGSLAEPGQRDRG